MAVRPSSASPPSTVPALVPQGRHAGKPNIPLTRPCMIIGANPKSHFHLVSPTISKVHAALVQTDAGVYIRDLASRTHVLINGKQTNESMLVEGDRLSIGAFTFLFRNRGSKTPKVPKPALNASIAVDGEPIPIPFDMRTLLIGRRSGCDIHLIEASVSNCHALIFEQNGARWIRDLHSRTGTFVNGVKVHQQQLELDDDLRIGDTQMRYIETAATSAHIDELEDLVGTAKLHDDEPLETELPESEPIPVSKPRDHSAEPIRIESDEADLLEAAVPAAKNGSPAAGGVQPAAEHDEYDLAPPASTPSKHVTAAKPAMAARAIEEPISLEPSAEAGAVSEAFEADDIPLAIPVEEEPDVSHAETVSDDLIPLAVPVEESDADELIAMEPLASEPFSSDDLPEAIPVDEPQFVDATEEEMAVEEPISLEPAPAEAEPIAAGHVTDEISLAQVQEAHVVSESDVESVVNEPVALEPLAAEAGPVSGEPTTDESPAEGEIEDSIPLEPIAAEAELTSEALSVDQIPLEIPADELHAADSWPQESEIRAPVAAQVESNEEILPQSSAEELPVEASSLAAQTSEPIPVAHDIATPESPLSDGTVAFDLSDVTEEVSPTLELPPPPEPSAHAAPPPALEPLLPPLVKDDGFAVAIADELHPDAGSVSIKSRVEFDAVQHQSASIEPEINHSHDQKAEFESPSESSEGFTLELPPPPSDAEFDDLIADELHPDAGSASIESPVELDAAHRAAPIESTMQAVHDQMADIDSPTESSEGFTLELPPPPSDAEFDDLIADELHPETSSPEVDPPPGLQATPLDAEPLEPPATADVAVEHPPQLAVAPTAAEFDDLIADELHPEAAADVEPPAPVSSETEEISLESQIELGSLASSPEFDELIAGELTPEVTYAQIESLTEVDSSHPESASTYSAGTQEADIDEFAVSSPSATSDEFDDLISAALSSESQQPVIEPPLEATASSQQLARVETSLEMPDIVEPTAEYLPHSAKLTFDDLIVGALRPQPKRESPIDVQATVVESHLVEKPSVSRVDADANPQPQPGQARRSPARPGRLNFDDLIAMALRPPPAPVEDRASVDTSARTMTGASSPEVFDVVVDEALPPAAGKSTVASASAKSLPPVIDQTSGADSAEIPTVVQAEHDLFADDDLSVQTPSHVSPGLGKDVPASTLDGPNALKGEGFSVFEESAFSEPVAHEGPEPSQVSSWPDTGLADNEAELAPPSDAEALDASSELEASPVQSQTISGSPESEELPELELLTDEIAEAPAAKVPTVARSSVVAGQSQASRGQPPVSEPRLSFKDRIFSLWGRKKSPSPVLPAAAVASSEPSTLTSHSSEIEPTIDIALPDVDVRPTSVAATGLGSRPGSRAAGKKANEVIEPTDPTPESAQTLAHEINLAGDLSSPSETIDSSPLTDSSFARAVEDFTSAEPAPLVELPPEPAEAIEPAPPLAPTEPMASSGEIPAAPVATHAPPSAGHEEALDDLVFETFDSDAPTAQSEPLSEEEAGELLSGAAAASEPLPGANGVSAAGKSPGDGNGEPPTVTPPAAPLPVAASTIIAAADAAVVAQTSVAKAASRRIGFWRFGRKSAEPEAPAPGSGNAESEPAVNITPSDPSISITSSSAIDLDFDGSISSSPTVSTTSDLGEFPDVVAPAQFLDAPQGEVTSDAELADAEAINIELSDAARSDDGSGLETFDTLDGLVLEPDSDAGAAVAASDSVDDLELHVLDEQPISVDEVVSELPSARPELELPAAAPLPGIGVAPVHLAVEAIGSAAEAMAESPVENILAIDARVTASEVHLPEAPTESLAASEPAPLMIEPSGSGLESLEEIGLPLAGSPPITLEPAPASFQPREEIPVFVPPIAASQQQFLPAEELPLSIVESSEMVTEPREAITPRISISPPIPAEPGPEAFVSLQTVTELVPPAAVAPEPPMAMEHVPAPFESFDASTFASPVVEPIQTEPIRFSPAPAMPAAVAPGEETVLPFVMDEPFDLGTANDWSLPPVEEFHPDDLPFLELDSSDAPPLAVDAAALASVAAATREILADATPPPKPPPPKPAIKIDPDIPLISEHDLELPPPPQVPVDDLAFVDEVEDVRPTTLAPVGQTEEVIFFEPQAVDVTPRPVGEGSVSLATSLPIESAPVITEVSPILSEAQPIVAEPSLLAEEPVTLTEASPALDESSLVLETPIIDEPLPVADESPVVATEFSPIVDDDDEPALVDEDVPVLEELAPPVVEEPFALTELSPVVDEAAPSAAQTLFIDEPSPAVSESPARVPEVSPIVDEPTPNVAEQTPVPENVSADVSDVPAVATETAAVFVEPSPSVSEPAPVAADVFPSVSEPPLFVTGTVPALHEAAVPAAGEAPPADEEATLEFDDEPGALTTPAPAAESAPTPSEPASSHPAPDPFFGMARDLGTFLGGMPIDLSTPPVVPISSLFAPPDVSSKPIAATPEVAADIVVASPAEPENVGEDADESIGRYLSKMDDEQPQQDLFESTPDSLDSLPDSMRPIDDVVEVLGEHPHAAPPSAPPAAPALPPAAGSQQVFTSTAGAAPMPSAPARPPTYLPPRPRLANRSLAASPFDFGSQPASDITIPPYSGGSITSGQITTELDGLAIQRPREADVFGQSKPHGDTFVPPVDPGKKGAAMLTALSASPPEALPPRVRPDADIPRRPRGVGVPPQDRRGPRSPVDGPASIAAPARRKTSPPPQFDGLPPVPPAAPLNLHLRIVLPIIVLLALTTAAGIWFFYHVSGTAQGRLRFDNLQYLRPSETRAFELAQEQLLRNPDLRISARQIFQSRNEGKLNEGFLSLMQPEQSRAYENLVSTVAIDPKSSQLLLTTTGSDPQGDARRLSALVQALYAQDQHQQDLAASAHLAYDNSSKAVDAASAEINQLTPAIQEEQDAHDQLVAAQQNLDQNKARSAELWQKWNDAARQLHAAQADEDRLEGTAPASGSAAPGSPQAAASDDADPQLKELSQQLAAATESLTHTRIAHSSAADQANRALDEALGSFRERINAAQGALKDGSQLSAYLVAAQQAQDTIHQLNADLVERQQTEQQRLADLRRELADKQETRLKAAWAADTQLQQMEQDLSVAEHRYNAAVGSGLDADAATLKTEVESLKNQIDARRDLIGTGDIYADEVKSLQQFIDDSLKGMEADRARADMRMGDMLKALAAAAPQMEKLPADQQALEESLNKKLDEINSARQLQAQALAAANPEADAAVKKLEASITELQAKMDARRKQLADDNHKQLTAEQAQERAAALAKAKADLTAAEMEEAEASSAVRANKEQTDAAYSSVEALKAKAANLAADSARLSYLQSQLPDLKSQNEQLLAAWQRIPVPEAPPEDAASATDVHDPRLQMMLISLLGYALLTAGMLAVWGVSHRQYHQSLTLPRDEQIDPFEETGLPDHTDTLEPRGAAAPRPDAED
jgi:pSer/pThr/pTyr-binding forkhead associated (FHA) protein